MIKVHAIGGYGEIGRNMTLIEIDEESIVLDMGMHMGNLINATFDQRKQKLNQEILRAQNIIPNDNNINKKKVKAIIISHAHLDHINAAPYLEKAYDCSLYGSPFTMAVLLRQFTDNKIKQKNPLITLPFGKKIQISKNTSFELFPVTHSTPHTAFTIIYTKYGNLLYATDFKLDEAPMIGNPTDLERLKQKLGPNPLLMISECLSANKPGHTESEQIAKQKIENVLLNAPPTGMFITTFSSHIERLTTIVQVAKKLKRRVIFLGRSLEKYTTAAKLTGVSDLQDHVEICQYRHLVQKRLRRLAKEDTSKYIVVMTGHQAEPFSILHQILEKKLPKPWKKGDTFMIASGIIPTDTIIEARQKMDAELINEGLDLHIDAHVSGHAHADDLKRVLVTLNPKNVIPFHGEENMMEAYKKLVQTKYLPLRTGESVNIE